jgi:hypothetical protein
MDIVHSIGVNAKAKPEFLELVRTLGIRHRLTPLPGPDNALIDFEISESSHNWPEVKALIDRLGASDRYETIFEQQEIERAEWLRFSVAFQQGYPQPQSTWVTNPVNYDDFCQECGTFRQTRPFRIAKEPSLGRNHFMTLHWGNPIFCRRDVSEELEGRKIRGFEVWDVTLNKTGDSSRRIAQLFMPQMFGPGLPDRENLGMETCASCGVTKYSSHLRGVMRYRREAVDPKLDMAATHEWFGAGGKSAYREVLISNRLARLIMEKGWQGIHMKVVELVD